MTCLHWADLPVNYSSALRWEALGAVGAFPFFLNFALGRYSIDTHTIVLSSSIFPLSAPTLRIQRGTRAQWC